MSFVIIQSNKTVRSESMGDIDKRENAITAEGLSESDENIVRGDNNILAQDTPDTLIEEQSHSVWHFGAFEFTSDALRFVLIYVALMMVLGVGLYNLTVHSDMSVKALWAPIVSGSFFCMVPAPSIPKSHNNMFSPAYYYRRN